MCRKLPVLALLRVACPLRRRMRLRLVLLPFKSRASLVRPSRSTSPSPLPLCSSTHSRSTPASHSHSHPPFVFPSGPFILSHSTNSALSDRSSRFASAPARLCRTRRLCSLLALYPPLSITHLPSSPSSSLPDSQTSSQPLDRAQLLVMPAPAIVSDRPSFANAMPSSQLQGPRATATPTAQPIARPHVPFLQPSRSHANFEHLNSAEPKISPWDFPRNIGAAKTSAPPFVGPGSSTVYSDGNTANRSPDVRLDATYSHRHEAYAQPTARSQHVDYSHEDIQQRPSISSSNAPGTLFSDTASSANIASPLSPAVAQGQSMKPSIQSQQEQIQAIIARLEKMRPGFADHASPSLAGVQPRTRLSVPPLPHPSNEGPQSPRGSTLGSISTVGATTKAAATPVNTASTAYQGWTFDRNQLVDASGAPFYVAPQHMQHSHAPVSRGPRLGVPERT